MHGTRHSRQQPCTVVGPLCICASVDMARFGHCLCLRCLLKRLWAAATAADAGMQLRMSVRLLTDQRQPHLLPFRHDHDHISLHCHPATPAAFLRHLPCLPLLPAPSACRSCLPHLPFLLAHQLHWLGLREPPPERYAIAKGRLMRTREPGFVVQGFLWCAARDAPQLHPDDKRVMPLDGEWPDQATQDIVSVLAAAAAGVLAL